MAAKPNYANETQSFLHISSNTTKLHFHHAVAPHQVTLTLPPKIYWARLLESELTLTQS